MCQVCYTKRLSLNFVVLIRGEAINVGAEPCGKLTEVLFCHNHLLVLLKHLCRVLWQRVDVMQCFSADEVTGIIDGDIDNVVGEAGKSVVFDLEFSRNGKYELEITYSSELGELAQLPVSIYYNGMYVTTASVKGTQGAVKKITHTMDSVQGRRFFFRFVFGSNGLKLHHLKMTPLV